MHTLIKPLTIMLFAFLLPITLSAQDETLFDKINLRITGGWGGPHTIFSGFKGDNSFSSGGFGGVELGKTLFVGWGGYTMQSKIANNTTGDNFKLNYNGPHLSYSWMPSKFIHPNISVMAGPGKTFINDVKDDNIFIIQPALGVEINVFKWFRINVRGGYRAALDADINTNVSNEDISSIFGGLDFKFGWSWGSEKE